MLLVGNLWVIVAVWLQCASVTRVTVEKLDKWRRVRYARFSGFSW